MAERFIYNNHVGIDLSEQEERLLTLYKGLASIKELVPSYAYFRHYVDLTNQGGQLKAPSFGVNFTIKVENLANLNNTTIKRYFYMIQLMDTQISRLDYQANRDGVDYLVPAAPVYISVNSLSRELYDFEVQPPSDKTNNNKLYYFGKSFPSTLNIRIGHVTINDKSNSNGTYGDVNDTIVDNQGTIISHGQNIFKIQFRLMITQLHDF